MSTYILVVDDEPDVEHLFRQQFRRDIRSGRFVMEFAASAPEALERAKSIADPMLILILSDINMPGMSGLEMLPQVKAARPNVPVIMITAYGDAATKKKAAELWAAGLLTKPVGFAVARGDRQTPATGGVVRSWPKGRLGRAPLGRTSHQAEVKSPAHPSRAFKGVVLFY